MADQPYVVGVMKEFVNHGHNAEGHAMDSAVHKADEEDHHGQQESGHQPGQPLMPGVPRDYTCHRIILVLPPS